MEIRQERLSPARLSPVDSGYMLLAPLSYGLLDGVSALLTLAVAVGFLWVARWSRQGLHLLVATGFTLVAAGFLFVSASQFGSANLGPGAVDAGRMAFQMAGPFVLVLAYGQHHLTGRARVFGVGAAAAGALVALAGILWLLPPRGYLPPLPVYLAPAHALMAAAYFGCALLSGYGWHRRPTWGRAMVPLGFLAWAMSTYTWIFIDLGAGGDRFVPLAYGWRFAAILLMLWAMVRRPRPPPTTGPGGRDDAAP